MTMMKRKSENRPTPDSTNRSIRGCWSSAVRYRAEREPDAKIGDEKNQAATGEISPVTAADTLRYGTQSGWRSLPLRLLDMKKLRYRHTFRPSGYPSTVALGLLKSNISSQMRYRLEMGSIASQSAGFQPVGKPE